MSANEELLRGTLAHFQGIRPSVSRRRDQVLVRGFGTSACVGQRLGQADAQPSVIRIARSVEFKGLAVKLCRSVKSQSLRGVLRRSRKAFGRLRQFAGGLTVTPKDLGIYVP